MIKLNPKERLLIESWTNQYKLVGPGRIRLLPWQKPLTTLWLGLHNQSLQFEKVRTAEQIPLKITTQTLYRIDLERLNDTLMVSLPQLNAGGWDKILQWRTEHVLHTLLADYAWDRLNQATVQQRVERQLTRTLDEQVQVVGLQVVSVALVRTELPQSLQGTVIQTERDGLESRSRAAVLKEYFDLFGRDLAYAMPYIGQWELLNTLHKNGKLNYLLTSTGFSPEGSPDPNGPVQPVYQMQLPLDQAG